MEKIAILAFSDQGYALAQELAAALGGAAARNERPERFAERAAENDPVVAAARNERPGGPAERAAGNSPIVTAARSGQPELVSEWTARNFGEADALIYVGACGIAVRSIAPHVKDKTTDPAVVVIDERALHVIPILSGHLGGANDLARRIARITGSDCVLTTATDVNGVFAVDEWAKRQGLALVEKERIVKISGKLLAGGDVLVASALPITGKAPEGVRWILIHTENEEVRKADVIVDLNRHTDDALHLVPRICTLGVGCRKGTPCEVLEERFAAFLAETGIPEEAICAAATIDLKKDEWGLLDFVKKHGWPLQIYTAAELAEVAGEFTASEMVAKVTGVDNVCERSAVRASGGVLVAPKFAGGGVTFALAGKDTMLNWNWRKE